MFLERRAGRSGPRSCWGGAERQAPAQTAPPSALPLPLSGQGYQAMLMCKVAHHEDQPVPQAPIETLVRKKEFFLDFFSFQILMTLAESLHKAMQWITGTDLLGTQAFSIPIPTVSHSICFSTFCSGWCLPRHEKTELMTVKQGEPNLSQWYSCLVPFVLVDEWRRARDKECSSEQLSCEKPSEWSSVKLPVQVIAAAQPGGVTQTPRFC